MGPTLWDELTTTAPATPKLSLSYLPSHHPHHHKPPGPDLPGTETPPLQPMVSVPFKWEETPGRPRLKPSPPRPNGGGACLELPPRLAKVGSSPNTKLNGPRVGRATSDRLCFQGPSSRNFLGFENGGGGLEQGKAHFVSCRWPNNNGGLGLQGWGREHGNGSFDYSAGDGDDIIAEVNNMKLKVTRYRRSSKGSLHRLSFRSSHLLESICKSLKQMVARRDKESKVETGATW